MSGHDYADEPESQLIGHEPCTKCGSRDNLARYSDGHGYCFGCQHREPPTNASREKAATHMSEKPQTNLLRGGEIVAMKSRGIKEATAAKFGYRLVKIDGDPIQVAPYYHRDTRELVAQNCRRRDKKFFITGDVGDAGMFGQQLWGTGKLAGGTGPKKLVITEGEIDCMSVSQLQDNKWPVVSIPNGADGAKRSIRKNLEWLSTFEEVILFPDPDKAGAKMLEDCGPLFEPGRLKVARLPEIIDNETGKKLKDPNDFLKAGHGKEVIQAIWDAQPWRPDGIVDGSDLWDVYVEENTNKGYPYPWAGANTVTHGLRRGELVLLTAGSGVGKSATAMEIALGLIKQEDAGPVGMLMLEQSVTKTARMMSGLAIDKRLHMPEVWDETSEEDRKAAFEATLGTGRVFLYDHFGSTDVDNLLSRVRFMAKSLGCNWVILDHVSIVVSGMGDGDERRLIDNLMTKLRTLVEETGIGMILVSHLKRPAGDKGHEEGAVTSLSQLRGSHSLAQLSDIVIGFERDQQGETPDQTTVRVLKNRYSGETGKACVLKYNHETGRLHEMTAGEASGFSDESAVHNEDF